MARDAALPEPEVPAQEQPTEQPEAAEAAKPEAEQGAPAKPEEPKAEQQPEEKTDWKAKHDEAETKRRDFESRAARAERDRDQYREGLATLDRQWRAWVQSNAPDAFTKMMEAEQQRSGQATDQRAAQAQTLQVINGIYREGEKEFGDYLSAIAEDGVRLSSQSLEKHRQTFQKIRGTRAESNGQGATPKEPATATPAPPRVPGAGRAPAEAAPVWKEGQAFNPRGLISDGLKENAARRGEKR